MWPEVSRAPALSRPGATAALSGVALAETGKSSSWRAHIFFDRVARPGIGRSVQTGRLAESVSRTVAAREKALYSNELRVASRLLRGPPQPAGVA